jgi:hypothetical protein
MHTGKPEEFFVKYSRRHLLRVAPAALAAATLPRAFGAEGSADNRFVAREKFTSLVNDAFYVQLDTGGSRWFTLLSVKDTARPPEYQPTLVMPRYLRIPASRKLESFALNFQSSGEPLAQGTYNFEHKSLGIIKLFIVPSGDFSYVATINRFAVE